MLGGTERKTIGGRKDDQTKWMKYGGLALVSSMFFFFIMPGDSSYSNVNVGFLSDTEQVLRKPLSTATGPLAGWKANVEETCRALLKEFNFEDKKDIRVRKAALEASALEKLYTPKSVTGALPEGHQPYQHCRNVFIDLGTNIGDSIGHFVDSAVDACSPIWSAAFPKTQYFPRPHLDVTKLEWGSMKTSNPLYWSLKQQMNQFRPPIQADSFCLYGMEGNPAFTERLQKLENYIMSTSPRPVQHLHIHTESVVTAVDGPTQLFLDKTSVGKNFWGSSILKSNKEVQDSKVDGEVLAAKVDGISLSTLVKRTTLPFKPGATASDSQGGMLIIKMDVEGAEYQVLKEISASGVLCDYAKKGNKVAMIVEFHDRSIQDRAERKREREGATVAKETLQKCGVEFINLKANWN